MSEVVTVFPPKFPVAMVEGTVVGNVSAVVPAFVEEPPGEGPTIVEPGDVGAVADPVEVFELVPVFVLALALAVLWCSHIE